MSIYGVRYKSKYVKSRWWGINSAVWTSDSKRIAIAQAYFLMEEHAEYNAEAMACEFGETGEPINCGLVVSLRKDDR